MGMEENEAILLDTPFTAFFSRAHHYLTSHVIVNRFVCLSLAALAWNLYEGRNFISGAITVLGMQYALNKYLLSQ